MPELQDANPKAPSSFIVTCPKCHREFEWTLERIPQQLLCPGCGFSASLSGLAQFASELERLTGWWRMIVEELEVTIRCGDDLDDFVSRLVPTLATLKKLAAKLGATQLSLEIDLAEEE